MNGCQIVIVFFYITVAVIVHLKRGKLI